MAQKLITTLNEFIEWVQQFDSESYLFRGVSNAEYRIEASAFRRPKESERDFEKFLQINRSLIRDARLQGYDEKDGRKLKDLEILAEFQHFGAATCLIDFTYNALIALWFACQSDSKTLQDSSENPDGKVFAVRNEPPRFKEITLELLKEDIGYFFQNNGDELSQIPQSKSKLLYQWQPRQQNHRIIAQQSIFLFGDSHFDADVECIILESKKPDILTALQQGFGITEAMLFPDFAGLARLRSTDIPYTELGASEYRTLASREFRRREYELAITHYDAAINLDPDDAHTYYQRGRLYALQEQYRSAIADYDKAINLKGENHAEFYQARGDANFRLKQYPSAITDYSKVLGISRRDGNCYYRRGLAKAALKQHEAAISDFDEAICLFPNYAEFYRWRGYSKYELEQYEKAISDYDEAIRIYPGDRKSYYQRGLANLELKEYELAISDFDKAISLSHPLNMDPDDAYIYYQRGLANKELDCDKARTDLQIAFSLAVQIDDDPELAPRIHALLLEINSHNNPNR